MDKVTGPVITGLFFDYTYYHPLNVHVKFQVLRMLFEMEAKFVCVCVCN